MAGTPGRSWGTAGTRQAIVHQLQVWRVEGVRPRQVRYGREHPPAGETEGGGERDPAPGNVTGGPRNMPGSAPLRRSVSSPGTPSPAGPTAKAAATRDSRPRAAERPGRAHLPKMANTQPLAGQGCGSQRPNVLPARRSVPFARRHRDARRASLRHAPLICGKERRTWTSSRPPSNPIPAHVQPQPFRPC